MIILILYILISFYFGRRNPMFYLILPWALQQGEAAFISQKVIQIGGKYILSPLNTIFTDVLFCIFGLIAIFQIKIKFPKKIFRKSILISLYFYVIFFLLLVSFLESTDSSEVFLSGRQFLYISLSYFLWLSIFQSVTREQFEEFLKLILFVTPISTLLYILNSSGLVNLFDKKLLYQEVSYGGETFIRDFSTIPFWLIPSVLLSVLSILLGILKLPKIFSLVNICILLVGVLFTFTRSVLLYVFIQTVFIIFLSLIFKYKQRLKLMIWVPIFAISILLIFNVIGVLYPKQQNFFLERIVSAKQEGKNEQNVNIRLNYLEEAIAITNETSIIIGAGFDRKYYKRMDAIGAWIADSTIPYHLIHTGWLGVILLYSIVLSFLIDSVLLYIKTKDWLILFLSSFFLMGAISFLFMGGGGFQGSTWTLMYFALYTTIRTNSWKQIKIVNKFITNEILIPNHESKNI